MAKWTLGWLIKFGFRRSIEGLLVLLLVLFLPNLPPFVEITQPFKVAKRLPFEGPLELKETLNDVQIWHKGDLVGPEAFVDLNGELYTSIYGGDIVKLIGEHITPVVKFGKPCKGSHEEKICGRPLGMDFDKDGFLYAVDAYYGLFKVNVQTGEKQQLVSPKTKIKGKAAKVFNSIVVASTGDIYWTDSSTDFALEDGLYSFLSDPSGRLIHYDPKTKKNTVLLEKIHFANGIALSEDEEFILVAETVQSRIHRYYLKGPKKGTNDIFIEGLPGLPDNLKSDGKGGFLVPLIQAADDGWPAIYQLIGPFPIVRKGVARFMGIGHFIIKQVNAFYPTEIGAKVVHIIGHFQSIPLWLFNPRVTILRLNKNGEITHSLHNLNRKISLIAETHIFGDTLYLGSPFNNYIGRISLDKIGWSDLKTEKVKRSVPVETAKPKPTAAPATPKPTEAPKPTTTTPKPTTTTPKPTTTTPKPTTTTPKPTTTTPKPTTTTPKPTTTTTKPTTTTPKPTTTTPKPTTQAPTTTQKPVTQPPTTQKPVPNETPKPIQQAPEQAQPVKEAAKPAAKPAETPKQTQPPKEAPKPTTQPPKPTPAEEAPKVSTPAPKESPKTGEAPKQQPKVESKKAKNEL